MGCLLVLTMVATAQNNHSMTANLYPALAQYLNARAAEFDQIPAERRDELSALAAYIRQEQQAGNTPQLTFICTHNSRRSHMAQLWMAVAMVHTGAGAVQTYSGGTEVTAFNTRAVKAMREAGFVITAEAGEHNTVYMVSWSDQLAGAACFSKHYGHETNPQQNFAAVMTCSQADEACPIVFGAAARFAVAYEDPKQADNTPEEGERYAQRCQQIAREMLFVAHQVANH